MLEIFPIDSDRFKHIHFQLLLSYMFFHGHKQLDDEMRFVFLLTIVNVTDVNILSILDVKMYIDGCCMVQMPCRA